MLTADPPDKGGVGEREEEGERCTVLMSGEIEWVLVHSDASKHLLEFGV